jgi:hypothetical protein
VIEGSTVDAYDEEERLGGFFNLIEENLAVPFETTVLGVAVTVEGVSQTSAGLVAECARGKHRQAIHLLDLPLPTPPPPGVDWIAAYRQWCD